jgi:hypothetical protein
MIQNSEKTRLLVETRAPLRIPGEVIGENLESNLASEPGVAGPTTMTHMAEAGTATPPGSAFSARPTTSRWPSGTMAKT